ncbi:phage terminase large subunit [Devosia yakushimensis]|uniref:Phage terminase large subunit n=1 Tax=Devosia yakushimensis TaxID=470028 RepID=A0ABQ5UB92_9HYPH|nr:hypothetical protein [Devosia yakushimensis]GLQ09233.1 phage terminase large subunit [Devosia yakushimensis]
MSDVILSKKVEALQHQLGRVLTTDELTLFINLQDPHWRLRNLYWIMDKEGNPVLFSPNEVQDKFIREIWFRNVVPKARQRGFSTVVQILMLDHALFEPNQRCGIIAETTTLAEQIFGDKIKFAYDRLPPLIREMVPARMTLKKIVLANNSSIRCATSVRGGTIQWLHVTEYGKICQVAPIKAKEIQTGSIPAVDKTGIVVVESTVEGLDGNFTELVLKARATAQLGRPLGEMDYRLHFASWWDASEYETDPTGIVISPKDHAYFARLEATIGRDISLPKRAWYVQKRDVEFGGDQEKMWMQYPSTLDEAFTISTEGKWLANQMATMRKQNRITHVPYDPAYPVNLWWDLGVDDDIAIWFHQQVGLQDRFIDYIEASGEPYAYFKAEVDKRGYALGHCYLPHDGAHRRPGAEILKTSADMIGEVGFRNIEIVPRIHELITGIQQLRNAMSSYWIDETKCAEGIKHLDGYGKVWNVRTSTYTSQVAQNGHQHATDALRQHAQAKAGGIIMAANSGQTRPKRRNKGAMAA